MNKRRALFLDRDGVINVDRGYVHTPEQFEFIDGIFDLCRRAVARGYIIVVVTNQAGIGRGYYTEQDFHALSEWMRAQFLAEGIEIAKIYFCADHPELGIGEYRCDSILRKPAPGMLLAAAKELCIDLAASTLVGDSDTDIQAGIRAGVGRNILFAPCVQSLPQETCVTVSNLRSVLDYLT